MEIRNLDEIIRLVRLVYTGELRMRFTRSGWVRLEVYSFNSNSCVYSDEGKLDVVLPHLLGHLVHEVKRRELELQEEQRQNPGLYGKQVEGKLKETNNE